jgi:choline transport protein
MAISTSFESERKRNGIVSIRDVQQADSESSGPTDEYESTRDDVADMRRLGKKQELKRNFRKFSTLSFATIIMATWEVLLVANSQALTNGGRPAFVYSYIWTTIGFAPIIVSLAEMSSM